MEAPFRIPTGSIGAFYLFLLNFLALVAEEGLEPPTHGL
jgi:hypothetical protein